jgi:glycine C-acetyltransferase
MYQKLKRILKSELEEVRKAGLSKKERILESPQSSRVRVGGKEKLIFCSNNYLGLANHPKVVEEAKKALDRYGYGLSSVRFICGTQTIHRKLEESVSDFLGTDDAILYSSCFDANAGLFPALLTAEDAAISDSLNHASIIDGLRLCKAERHIFGHANMSELAEILEKTMTARLRLIVTDGVFSMSGDFAKLKEICELARKYEALVTVDDSHATGLVGENGRGTPNYFGVESEVDIITSTFGKALGGAGGGFIAGRKEIIDFLRERSRPYLFSNSLMPVVAAVSLKNLESLKNGEFSALIQKLGENTKYFREKMSEAGFELRGDNCPIAPVMIYDAKKAKEMADRLFEEGIYVVGFSYPVVPEGEARIRVQLSASHSQEEVEQCVRAFIKIGREMEIIK